MAGQLGVSRPTAQRYLSVLEQKGLLVLDLTYGGTGRAQLLHGELSGRPATL
ncbi:helix-turn-helix domain-containing protein [Arthrobacter sp. Hiyo1]|uniref:helix-turn-helix domain-containing protein n=1 Tax=Arthrobacter sp. Hiyo1 TaxID=1588020 RepID=UPI00404025BD